MERSGHTNPSPGEALVARFKKAQRVYYESEIERAFTDLEILPRDHPEEAVMAYRVLARNEDERLRRSAAFVIHNLLRANRREAISIWKELLVDESKEVRETAIDAVGEAMEKSVLSIDEAVALHDHSPDSDKSYWNTLHY